MPPRPAGALTEPDYSQPGVLEDIATRAGLTPEEVFDVTWAYDYPDEDTLGRALVAPMGIAMLLGPDREEQFKQAIVERFAPHRDPDGHYRLENEFHCLIARA
jgi:hypothetical protein